MKNKPVITLADVKHTAKLANLDLTPAEFADQDDKLNSILTFVSEVQTLDLDGQEPVAQVTNKTNELREDIVTPSLDPSEALANAPHSYNGFFLVPRILQDE